MLRFPRQPADRRAFTLVEILIVVVILGILAAIVMPLFADVTRNSGQAVFVTDVRTFNDAAQVYMETTGEYLEDSSSGALPAGWGPYVNETKWLAGPNIGGVWDFEHNSYSVTSAFGVHFNGNGDTQDAAYMTEIDAIYDDGVLTTGMFRQIAADRYYHVIEP